jgi:M6 family metalloprotease-like protein
MGAFNFVPLFSAIPSRWTKVLFLVALIGGVDLQFPQQAFSQEKMTGIENFCAAKATVTSQQLTVAVINLKILLVQFADVGCRKDTDGVSPRYSVSEFENLLGSEGIYVSPGMHSPDGDELYGSMNDYYLNMSGGKMRIHAFVINRRDTLNGKPVWITLAQTKQYYQQASKAILIDAFEAAYDAGLDPSMSDTTRTVIIYAGNTYFQRGGLNPGALEFRYIMSELQSRPYNQELPDAKFSRIGIHCHEFGHTIGVEHSTGGRADVMCGGTTNGSMEGNAPAPFNAIVRAHMGWASVIPVESVNSLVVDLSYSLTSPTVYLMKNSQGDLFYIENRRFDQTMAIGGTIVPDYNNERFFPPAGPHHSITQGIFVWRLNTSGDVLDAGYSTEGLVYASGRYGRTYPENERSDTDDGVPFPGVSNNRLLSPWSDPRNPYLRETDYFGSASPHYNLFVPNTKGRSNAGMEVLSEDRAGGTFRVRFYTSNPPNPALAHQPVADSIGSYDSRRTIIRGDSAAIHQVMDLGGEILYRRSTDRGLSWSAPLLISQGNGGNSVPCMALAGSALLVAWQMDTYDAADTGRGVYLSRSTDSGKSWSDCVNVGWSYRCSAPGAYPSLAGAKDRSAMLIYQSDRSSLVSALSHDGGISWSDPSPVPVGSIASKTLSLAIRNVPDEALIAYATDSLSGPLQVRYDRFAYGAGVWGGSGTVSDIIPNQYAGFRNPALVAATEGPTSALSVAWDATDTFAGGTSVIIFRGVGLSSPGSSYCVFKGKTQNDLTGAQVPLALLGTQSTSYFRMLSLLDSASGASVSIEIGSIRLLHRDGKADTIRFSESPSDSLLLDIAGLMNAGRTSTLTLSADADTIQIVAAIYGHNPGLLFADGRVGFEIVRAGSESVITQFGVIWGASVANEKRRLALFSIPVSSVTGAGNSFTVSLRPFVAGLAGQGRLTASLAHIYSNVSENPVDQILSGVGGKDSPATAPQALALEQNYPNPFNPSTTIRYGLPQRADVSLVVYSVLGQKVATLVQEDQEAGYHEVRFDGSALASGVYICRLKADSFVQSRKLILLR